MTMTRSNHRSVFSPPAPRPTEAGLSRRAALIASALATGLAGLGMLILRSSLQVRTIPERLMEWLLLFVSPQAFEAALQRFGFDAKRYALGAAVLTLLLLLGWLGYLVLRRGWPARAIVGTGVTLWLFVMLVVMPLTAAGPFALDLLDGKRAAIGGYLAVSLTFSAALVAARVGRFARVPAVERGTPAGRRAALALLGSAGAAYIATFLAATLLPKSGGVASVILEDPQEPVASGGIDAPNPHPNVVGTPPTTSWSNADAESSATASPVPRPNSASALPEPASNRQVARDKDGAVLPTLRKPGELAPALTSNVDFYVVTKNAAGDPLIHANDWRLLIDGEVERSFQLDYATLRKLPSVEVTKTLECISNFVGKPELAPFGAELISTAVWKGVRARDILWLVGGPKANAAWVAVLSADEFTSALPLDAVMDPATLLVYEMNGEVLPREHGYPARLLVPNRYGMKNAKWVVGLRPMRREFTDWYGQRNWSKEGIVKTMTRIDTPAPGATLASGSPVIAGVAYAGARGIENVEYSMDGGRTWQTAELLEDTTGEDRWVRWRGNLSLNNSDGPNTLVARATDGTGETQIEAFSLSEPSGGTGWPRIDAHVEPA